MLRRKTQEYLKMSSGFTKCSAYPRISQAKGIFRGAPVIIKGLQKKPEQAEPQPDLFFSGE